VDGLMDTGKSKTRSSRRSSARHTMDAAAVPLGPAAHRAVPGVQAGEPAPVTLAPSLYLLSPLLAGGRPGWPDQVRRIAALGFDAVLLQPPFLPGPSGSLYDTADHDRLHPAVAVGAEDGTDATLAALAAESRAAGVDLWLDLALDRFADTHRLVHGHPHWFHRGVEPGTLPDPRRTPPPRDVVFADRGRGEAADGLGAYWAEAVARWSAAGIAGFRLLAPERAPEGVVARIRAAAPAARLLAWMPGAGLSDARRVVSEGADLLSSSFAWWDLRGDWLWEEWDARARLAPLVAAPEPPEGPRLAATLGNDPVLRQRAAGQRLRLAALAGHGLLVPMGFEFGAERPLDPVGDRPGDWGWITERASFDLSAEIAAVHRLRGALGFGAAATGLRPLTAPGATVVGFARADGGDLRGAGTIAVAVANTDLVHAATLHAEHLLPGIDFDAGALAPLEPPADAAAVPGPLLPGAPATLGPGEVRVYRGQRAAAPAGLVVPAGAPLTVDEAARADRIAIEDVRPRVDDGRFAVKRVAGGLFTVEADIVVDGHEHLRAVVLWRPAGSEEWSEAEMVALGNDRWRAAFPLAAPGSYFYTVAAWRDVFGSFRDELEKKHGAGLGLATELEEGRLLVARVARDAPAPLRQRLESLFERLEGATDSVRLGVLLSDELAAAMRAADPRAHLVRHPVAFVVQAERAAAAFAAWYEIFPRSASDDAGRHGTFDDVIGRLPAIRAMGFDVLYFPPIHPIGAKNRKGRNNSLTPGPGDPGSPYAIGAAEGGHDAIHPQLGTREDFRRLVAAAAAEGLEIALDFAIQASPDHPWLTEHPEWFSWRPDGSIRYAENPPKKYEDIVNVDFYGEKAVPALWEALRDIVLFWVGEGVNTFRVDNPHTKPLPFWEWLIGEVRGRHPDALFLSEAFTRPKMMYRLAKVGFSQSYTYFTWRDTKAELTDYLTELTRANPREFFRPHFFVNTPDINPRFLQTSGRPGFLIRAALATTLSGLWGMYNGFELCEGRALPGKEEYLDSEKYEIRAWDWDRPGNIVGEITRLNAIRRANPALHSHLGVRFLNAWNERVLYYEKATPTRDNVILVAVSLDPHGVQEAAFELPLWDWGLPDSGALAVEDLMTGQRWVWHGKNQHLRLDPAHLPFAIWRVRPLEGLHA